MANLLFALAVVTPCVLLVASPACIAQEDAPESVAAEPASEIYTEQLVNPFWPMPNPFSRMSFSPEGLIAPTPAGSELSLPFQEEEGSTGGGPTDTTTISDSTGDMYYDMVTVTNMNAFERFMNPFATFTIGLNRYLNFSVKTTATAGCNNGTPFINDENHQLLGQITDGVDVTVFKLGYRLIWTLSIDSTSVATTYTDSTGANVITKTYTHDMVIDFEKLFVFTDKIRIDVGDVTTTLTWSCPKTKEFEEILK